jgi:hypothetical protein
MKHIFYLIYVLSFSGAVFVSGMFVGQLMERIWSRREAKMRAKTSNNLSGATITETGKGLHV